jgi:hypothetical protein
MRKLGRTADFWNFYIDDNKKKFMLAGSGVLLLGKK